MAFNLEDYTTVQERSNIFWERYPNGAVRTKIISESDTRVIVVCELFRDSADEKPFATGHAKEVISDRGVNRDFALENCETSARGVAFKAANIGTEKNGPSREEMVRVSEKQTEPFRPKYGRPGSKSAAMEYALHIVDAQEKLTEAKFKLQQIESYQPQYDEKALQTAENEVKIPEQSQQPQRLDSKTQAWLDKNSWYGVDDDMSFLAMGIHRKLERNGVVTGSDEYWNAIDTEMRKRFPEKFAGENTPETKDSVKKPSTVVAPATRSTSPKKIRLTQTQLALAKKFKLSPEQYALELTKLESQNG